MSEDVKYTYHFLQMRFFCYKICVQPLYLMFQVYLPQRETAL
jgi:hypothetical protein